MKTEHGWGRGLARQCCSCTASLRALSLHTLRDPSGCPCPSTPNCPPFVCPSVRADVCLNLHTRCVCFSFSVVL